jgi:hypothetical protein
MFTLVLRLPIFKAVAIQVSGNLSYQAARFFLVEVDYLRREKLTAKTSNRGLK